MKMRSPCALSCLLWPNFSHAHQQQRGHLESLADTEDTIRHTHTHTPHSSTEIMINCNAVVPLARYRWHTRWQSRRSIVSHIFDTLFDKYRKSIERCMHPARSHTHPANRAIVRRRASPTTGNSSSVRAGMPTSSVAAGNSGNDDGDGDGGVR